MKTIYLFCTKPWLFLTEVPVVALFWIAVKFNKYSDLPVKFYPLIFTSAFFIIFIMLYFFRAISISYDEIRCHGLFSSRDNALISENKTLTIALHPHSNLKLELYEDASKNPAFEWMKASDVMHRDVCIFRARAIGGKKSIQKILKFYTLPEESLADATTPGFTHESDAIKVTTVAENEVLKVNIKFKITMI